MPLNIGFGRTRDGKGVFLTKSEKYPYKILKKYHLRAYLQFNR